MVTLQILITLGLFLPAFADDKPTGKERKLDLSKDKVLYCIGYAHLDTQWRWDYPTTISRFIRDTLEKNFDRFEKYPGYVFNFTGSVRYEMMKEYYPELYAKLKEYVAQGRWFVSGSSVDEGDVNVPSAEAVLRHVLYGNRFFKKEFGKESIDFMLPDCFGFPASMPSIWAHCGLKGFSTQKLTWGSAMGIPFKVGVWEGPDGKGVIAAFDPGPYSGGVKGRLDKNPEWVGRVNKNGEKYGVWADYHYYGVGDQGGAPLEEDISNYLSCVDQPDSQIHLALTSSDQMYKDITDEQRARLPRYKGDLLLTEHSAGTLTSQAYMKRWNRKNEQLADAAERAAVMAHWLGVAVYPREKLYKSWVRVLGNQMHDILPGTSIPRAYTYSWNDEIVASNGFAAVLTDSIGAVASAMNTSGEGIPLIVYNALAISRNDPVEAEIIFDKEMPKDIKVLGPDGQAVRSQILDRGKNSLRILFEADVPALSVSTFHVQPRNEPRVSSPLPRIDEDDGKYLLQSESLRVVVNSDGDVASIAANTQSGTNLLAAPAQLVFTHEKPKNWPAWNMDWADRQKPPIDVVKGPAKITITERGPVRVALRVERAARDSIITQEIRLCSGDAGRRVEFKTEVDWQSTECALKASFPLKASNPKATYNWEVGTIERSNNEPTKYEVPSHQWFDLTDASGKSGVSVLEDCKYGSDKPSDNELRLTLLYTPGVRKGYLDQHSQDWGRHEMVYALYPHDGDWRDAQTQWQARRLNQPLRAFQTVPYEGVLPKQISFLSVSTPRVDVRAIKLAEDNDFVVVRLQELCGRPADAVKLQFASEIAEAYEVDGQERRIGKADFDSKTLQLSITPNSPKSFMIRLLSNPLAERKAMGLALQFNADVASYDHDPTDGRFDQQGRTIPAEELQAWIISEGVRFHVGPTDDGQNNAVSCRGQTVPFPHKHPYKQLYLLMAATEDTQGSFTVDDQSHKINVQSWTGFVGQWDTRVWDRPFEEVDFRWEGRVTGILPGFIKPDTIAWFCTHRHHPFLGNEPYRFSYLYKYSMPIEAASRQLTLPNNPRIYLFAATMAENPNESVRPAAPLYDDFDNQRFIEFRHHYPPPLLPVFKDSASIAKVAIDRADSFDKLSMGPPVKTDYADHSSGHDLQFKVFDEGEQYPPNPGSGVEQGRLPRLNDGEVAQNEDDTQRNVWYDNEGRFYIDLKKHIPIKSINSYSRHRSNRAPQYFSLWASDADEMPSADIKHGAHDGWTLLGVVDTRPLGNGGVHGSSVTAPKGSLGPYRHLLWVAENIGEGTFFTEIDIHSGE
jgi:alpha-mannosidase